MLYETSLSGPSGTGGSPPPPHVGAEVETSPPPPRVGAGVEKGGLRLRCGLVCRPSIAGTGAWRMLWAGSGLEIYCIISSIREGSRERREGRIEEARDKMEKARSKGTQQATGRKGRVEEA